MQFFYTQLQGNGTLLLEWDNKTKHKTFHQAKGVEIVSKDEHNKFPLQQCLHLLANRTITNPNIESAMERIWVSCNASNTVMYLLPFNNDTLMDFPFSNNDTVPNILDNNLLTHDGFLVVPKFFPNSTDSCTHTAAVGLVV